MTMTTIRIFKHPSIVPDSGSYEVRVEGQPSRYFCFEDLPGRRLGPEQLTSKQALEQAQAYARAIRDRP
jgi:hypothetical protein